jgi:hypothetical protein
MSDHRLTGSLTSHPSLYETSCDCQPQIVSWSPPWRRHPLASGQLCGREEKTHLEVRIQTYYRLMPNSHLQTMQKAEAIFLSEC